MGSYGLVSAWGLLAVFIAVAILIAVASVWLANRILSNRRGEHNSVLSPFLTVVGLVYGALLGFTVVVAWEQYSSAELNVSNEASTLTTMYRQTVGMPQPEQTQMREQLRRYANAVKGPEWDKQDSGGTSDTARAALTHMYRVLGNQQGVASNPVSQEFLGTLTALTSDRNTRVLDAKPRIPPLLWCALIFGGALLIGLTGAVRLESTPAHLILSSAVAALLGLLLYLVFILDHPFGNQLGVTSAPFQHSLEVFDAVDSGT